MSSQAAARPSLIRSRPRGRRIASAAAERGDTDHRGAAPALRAYADVVCHPDAVAQAEGSGGRDCWQMNELPADVRLLHGFLQRFVWDGGPVHVDGTVKEGESVAGFEVVELAVHAPGLIGLWRERDRVALVWRLLAEAAPVEAHRPG